MDFPLQDLSLQHISQSYKLILRQYQDHIIDGTGKVVITVGPNSGSINLSELVQNSDTGSMTVESASSAVNAGTSISSSHATMASLAEVAGLAYVADMADTASLSYVANVAINALTASYAPDYIKNTGDEMTGELIAPDFIRTVGGTITRDVDGYTTQIDLSSGRILTMSRIDGYISTVSDGIRTWTYNRDIDNRISSWGVTP
jgi:hypothetical protein